MRTFVQRTPYSACNSFPAKFRADSSAAYSYCARLYSVRPVNCRRKFFYYRRIFWRSRTFTFLRNLIAHFNAVFFFNLSTALFHRTKNFIKRIARKNAAVHTESIFARNNIYS